MTRRIPLRQFKEAVELYEYIQYLDEKYDVDSTDSDNSFGIIYLDRYILTNGVNNTLYLAGIRSSSSNPYRPLPTHTKTPHGSVILIHKTGDISLCKPHVPQKPEPITIDSQDIDKLYALRSAFTQVIQHHAPKRPVRNGEQTVEEKDYALIKQGFASGKEYEIQETFMVGTAKNTTRRKPFRITYERTGDNFAPYFSTTYAGWQNQKDMDPHHPAYAFYKKWDNFHLCELTIEEWHECTQELQQLKVEIEKYNRDAVNYRK